MDKNIPLYSKFLGNILNIYEIDVILFLHSLTSLKYIYINVNRKF